MPHIVTLGSSYIVVSIKFAIEHANLLSGFETERRYVCWPGQIWY